MLENGSVGIIHTSTHGYGFGNSADEVKRYQTFVAPERSSGFVSVRIKLRKNAGSGDTGMVELYGTDQHKPAGPRLASQTFVPPAGPDLEVLNVAFPFSSLVPGQEYALVLSLVDPNRKGRLEWAVAPVNDALGFGKWDGKQWVDESSLGDGWLAINLIDGDDAIDLTHDASFGFTFGETSDQIARFQTFLAPNVKPIVGVDVKVQKNPGTTHSDVVVELYDAVGGKPAGAMLASAVIPAESIGSSWTVVHAPLHLPRMIFEEEFAIVLRQRAPKGATYGWAVAPTNRVSSFGKWNGSSWIDESNLGDGWLKVWLGSPNWSVENGITHDRLIGNGFGNVTDEIKRYQTLQLAEDERRTVVGVDLKVRRFEGTAQSELTCELYAAPKNVPSGPPLASGTLPAYAIRDDFSIVHVPMKSPVLPAGTYAFVLTQKTLGTARYEWAVGSGSGRFGKWNGNAWIDETGLGNGWISVWTTHNTGEDVDFSHGSTSGYSFGDVTDELKRYQTFSTPAASWQPETPAFTIDYRQFVDFVQIKVRKVNGTTQSDLVVDLFETELTHNRPTRSRRSMVVPSGCIGMDWTIVPVPLHLLTTEVISPVYKIGRTKYAIVLSQRVPSAAHYEWATGAPAVDGEFFGKWNGTAWVEESNLGSGWLKVSLLKESWLDGPARFA